MYHPVTTTKGFGGCTPQTIHSDLEGKTSGGENKKEKRLSRYLQQCRWLHMHLKLIQISKTVVASKKMYLCRDVCIEFKNLQKVIVIQL